MKTIIHFFAKEHLFGNLLTILALLVGTYSLFQIRRDIWPNVEFNVTTVTTILGGASPEQIEKLIINPIEEALREVDGLDLVTSQAAENTAVTIIRLDPDAREPDDTNDDIQQAIDQIDDLPEDAEKPVVRIVEAGQNPVIEVAVAGKDPLKTRNAAKFVADELSRLPSVAKVNKLGYPKREYVVEADSEALARRRASLSGLIATIASRNISVPGGTVENDNGVETLVRTRGEYDSVEELKKTYLQANEAGFGTTIGEVATVYEGLAEPKYLYKANGLPSTNLVVQKKLNADALKLVESVKARVGELQGELKDIVKLSFSNDFSVYLSNRLSALSFNLLLGLLLVMVVLTIFLPWQVTAVVAVGIPVALLSTLSVFYLYGLSLNLINLIGLIIVLGMLVDDAIVVSENIWRHMEEGSDPIRAVTDGAYEVLAPVTASILTTICAFGPMLFMTGIFGAFVFEIPYAVILALVASFFEAFIIMPAHCSSWIRPPKFENGTQKKQTRFDRFAIRYQAYVRWSLKKRYWMLTTIAALLLGTGYILSASGRFILFPPEGIEIFFVTAEAPVGTSLAKMSHLIEPIEEQIADLPEGELRDYASAIGIIQQEPNDPQTRRGPNFAQVRVSLTPQHLRNREAAEIVEELRNKIKTPPGLKVVSYEYARQGPPQGRPISIDVLGEEYDEILVAAEKVEKLLKNIEGILDIKNSYVEGKDEWQIRPRYKDTAIVGLTATDIAQGVRAAFEGIVASSIRKLDEEVDIRIRLPERSGPIESQLKNLKIANRLGNLIPLDTIADFQKVPTVHSLSHRDYRRQINVSAEVDIDIITASEVVSRIRDDIQKISADSPNTVIQFGGEDEDTKESLQALFRAFLFAAFFIFCLLIVTFKNILQPILILTSIPLGFIGVVYAMLLHGRPFSFMSLLGVVALAGVIVNNAIVFTDFVNQQRKLGANFNSSILTAARIRLRPITLTTVTTVCGLMPTAYGEQIYKVFGVGGGDPFIVPIAIALGWGLSIGSLLTALFFPSFLRILDDVEVLASKTFQRSKPSL